MVSETTSFSLCCRRIIRSFRMATTGATSLSSAEWEDLVKKVNLIRETRISLAQAAVQKISRAAKEAGAIPIPATRLRPVALLSGSSVHPPKQEASRPNWNEQQH